MATNLPEREGCVSGTWYRVVGAARDGRRPVLCLHGGPGVAHDYLEPLVALAEGGRQVVLYDQLGCGRSPYPAGAGKWTIELFVDELDSLRRELDLPEIHLLGHSWGGMLALECLLSGVDGLASLVLSNTTPSTAGWEREGKRLQGALPDDVYWERHVCRVPQPDCLRRSLAQIPNDVFVTMTGPAGVLRGWDVTGRLGEIHVPTLLLSGKHGDVSPRLVQELHEGISGSEWELFEDSAHLPHLEEPERFLLTVGRFLDRHDFTSAPGSGPPLDVGA